ncbi:hypothetical protein [Hymenobacter sp. UYCo722]|uniref:hypothetical protein n=1 Tax=Hymenobacter sp. UYCo722 TaxID=3156335 RepID=UPI0033994F94
MANAKKNKQVAAPEIAAEITTAPTVEPTEIEQTETVAEAVDTTEEVVVEKAKRERNYSQSAVNTEDLTRMNALKADIKETRKINVSNQTLIAAALDCLAQEANMTAFLKSLATTAADRQRMKDLAAYAALKAKLEAPEATEAVTEEAAQKTTEA